MPEHGLPSLARELLRQIILYLHPRDLANLLHASHTLRTILLVDIAHPSFAARHLAITDGPIPHIPFHSLPLTYALALGHRTGFTREWLAAVFLDYKPVDRWVRPHRALGWVVRLLGRVLDEDGVCCRGGRFEPEFALSLAIKLDAVALVKRILLVIGDDTSPSRKHLTQACRDGAVAITTFFLQTGADVSGVDVIGRTPLHVAARAGHLPVVNALLAHGANASSAATDGTTPLMLAAQNGHVGVVARLLEAGASVHAATGAADGRNALHFAAAGEGGSQGEVVGLLVERGGAYVDARDAKGQTPLFYAVRGEEREGTVRELLGRGAGVRVRRGVDDATPLHAAVLYGSLGCVKLLVEDGGLTKKGDPSSITLTKGLDIDSGDKDDMTPLALAAETNKTDVAQFLLTHHANVDCRVSPLMLAVGHDNPTLVTALLAHGAQPDAVFQCGTPVTRAVALNRLRALEALLTHGADLNARVDNETPLLLAVRKGRPRAVRMLLKKGADANLGDGTKTPLFAAARAGQKGMVKALLAHGADPGVKCGAQVKMTAYEVAVQKGRLGTAELLKPENFSKARALDDGEEAEEAEEQE
ncbi:hypothetical protein HDU96_006305 [Phlyctochytrium bullatum]|nr:hypothetical protein HDU96_006305 [Phlyctochytrium bullatum]